MKISQLIAELQAMLDAHGDIEVAHHDDWDDFLVEKVEFMPEYSEASGYHESPHVVLSGNRHQTRDDNRTEKASGDS